MEHNGREADFIIKGNSNTGFFWFTSEENILDYTFIELEKFENKSKLKIVNNVVYYKHPRSRDWTDWDSTSCDDDEVQASEIIEAHNSAKSKIDDMLLSNKS